MKDKNAKTIKEQKTPTMIKEVESFLEFVNFYQCFIKNFSYITKLLNELKDKKKYKWKEEYQKAFKELKDNITSQLVLTLPRKQRKFRVETNTSKHDIKQILFWKQGKQKPIAFLLRTIQAAKRNQKI